MAANTDNSDILDDVFVDDDDDDDNAVELDPALKEFDEKFKAAHPDIDEADEKFERRKHNPYKPATAYDSGGQIPVQRGAKVDKIDDMKVEYHDTFFFEAFSKMRRQGFFSSDKNLHTKLSKTLLKTFEQQASIQMVIDDIGNSITALGIDSKFEYQALLKDIMSLLSLQTTARLIDDVGLSAYKDDIVLRLIEGYYGQTRKVEREKTARQRFEDDSRSHINHKLVDVTKILKDMAKDFKQTAALSKPTKQSVFKNSHLRKNAGDSRMSREETDGGDDDGDSR